MFPDNQAMKLSKANLQKAAELLPLDSILGQGASKELTHKQRTFARAVAKGATKADAYRSAYDVQSRRTMSSEPYQLASNPRVAQEIEALKLAEYAQSLQTPAQLRALVIQTLVQTALDPDTKAAVRVQAAKVLGTVTEVAAFTERKEVRTISTSEDARVKVMAEIRALMLGTDDAEDVEAKSLLSELEDTPPEYDDARPVDFIGDDNDDPPENDENHGLLSPDDGEIVGGVCGVRVGGAAYTDDGVPDCYDILSHSNDEHPPLIPDNKPLPK